MYLSRLTAKKLDALAMKDAGKSLKTTAPLSTKASWGPGVTECPGAGSSQFRRNDGQQTECATSSPWPRSQFSVAPDRAWGILAPNQCATTQKVISSLAAA